MVGYNERKLQILEYLLESEEATASQIAYDLGLEIHNARTLLRRYNQQGLVSRYSIDDYGTRLYEITPKGIERISWIRREFEEDELTDNDEEDDDEVDQEHYDEETQAQLTALQRALQELAKQQRRVS